MDLETVFLRRFAIEKKPDIFELIGAAIQLGAWKHPAEFEKHKHGLLKLLMSPDNLGDDVEEDEVIDSGLDEIEDDNLIANGVTEIEEDEVMDGSVAEIKKEESISNGGAEIEEGEGINGSVDDSEELVREKNCRFQEDQENYNVSNIKPILQQSGKHLVYDKENKTKGGMCRIISSVKGSATRKFTQGQQLGGDCSRHKRLGKEEKLNKQSNNRETKAKEGTERTLIQSNNKKTTEGNMGSATKWRSPMTKMNVAIKRVEVAPPHGKQLLSDCSQQKKLEEGAKFQKQNNCNNAITGTLRSKTGENIRDSKERWAAKFESSKRKFDERFEEICKAKRRAIVVDFHHMPKPPKDPSAPKRCWDRRRF